MTIDPHFLEAYLEDRLSPDQRNRLAEQFRADPQLAKAFVVEVQRALTFGRYLGDNPQKTADGVMSSLAIARPSRQLRIARGVDTRIRRRHRGGRRSTLPILCAGAFALAAGLLAAVLILGIQPIRSNAATVATVHAVSGEGYVDVAGDSRALTPGMVIQAEDLIKVVSGQVALNLPDDSRLQVMAASRLVLSGTGSLIQLHHGEVHADVMPRPDDPLVFQSEIARAIVIGTSLVFKVNADGTRLEVSEGLVALEHLANSSRVKAGAGQWAIARANKTLVLEPQTADPTASTIVLNAPAADLIRGGPAPLANGELGRNFREPMNNGVDSVLAMPLTGLVATLDLPVEGPGPWYVWYQWRDDKERVLSFDLLSGDQKIDSMQGSKGGKKWIWRRLVLNQAGPLAIDVEVHSPGRLAGPNAIDPDAYPYGFVARLGHVVVTADSEYIPPSASKP